MTVRSIGEIARKVVENTARERNIRAMDGLTFDQIIAVSPYRCALSWIEGFAGMAVEMAKYSTRAELIAALDDIAKHAAKALEGKQP